MRPAARHPARIDAALVYFWAIWTYTLLPLPDAGDYRCAGVNLDVWAFLSDLGSARSLTDPAVLQLALNVRWR